MRGAGHYSGRLTRIMIVGILAGGLSAPAPAAPQLFNAEQRRHVIDCLFWLLTDPASQAANCKARPVTTHTIGAAEDESLAGSKPTWSGGAGLADANTASHSSGSNTGAFNYGDQNTGSYNPGQNTGNFNDGDPNTGVYVPGGNTGNSNDGDSNTGSYN